MGRRRELDRRSALVLSPLARSTAVASRPRSTGTARYAPARCRARNPVAVAGVVLVGCPHGSTSGARGLRRADTPASGARRAGRARRARRRRDPQHVRRGRVDRRDLVRPGRADADAVIAAQIQRFAGTGSALGVEALLLRPAPGPARPAARGRFHARAGRGPARRRDRGPRARRATAPGRGAAGGRRRDRVSTRSCGCTTRCSAETTPPWAGPCWPVSRAGPARSRPWSPWPGETPISAGRVEFHHGTDFASLWGGGTLPAWRGRGVFRSLVAHRAALAAARGLPLPAGRRLPGQPADPQAPRLRRARHHDPVHPPGRSRLTSAAPPGPHPVRRRTPSPSRSETRCRRDHRPSPAATRATPPPWR